LAASSRLRRGAAVSETWISPRQYSAVMNIAATTISGISPKNGSAIFGNCNVLDLCPAAGTAACNICIVCPWEAHMPGKVSPEVRRRMLVWCFACAAAAGRP